MPLPSGQLRPPAWLHWPRRTARLRFTVVYGGLFLVSGVVLVVITYGLFQRATEYRSPQLPRVPSTQRLQLPSLPQLPQAPQLPRDLFSLTQDQLKLAQDQNALGASVPFLTQGSGAPPGQHKPIVPESQLAKDRPLLARDEHQLAQDQHLLAGAVSQLAQAVHQVAQAGPVQAAQRSSDSHQLLVNSGIALGIVAVLALLAGWLVAGRMLRPLRNITRTARRISSTSLHERLALDGPQDELKELGDTLDELFGRLDAAFEAQRRFVANASHELRTPLTAERNLLQVALDDPHTSPETWRATAEELLASNDEQAHLIDALLTLASSEGGLDHREHSDLSVIAHTVLRDPHPDADRLGLVIDADIASAPVDGDPLLLERLVGNLLDNAIRHNVAGGRVQISTNTRDGKALVMMTNTGSVIPLTEIDRLFEPFQRLSGYRIHHDHGHGLGLSIVRAIAIAHGATITTEPSPHGGVAIEVAFPQPADQDAPRATETSAAVTLR